MEICFITGSHTGMNANQPFESHVTTSVPPSPRLVLLPSATDSPRLQGETDRDISKEISTAAHFKSNV